MSDEVGSKVERLAVDLRGEGPPADPLAGFHHQHTLARFLDSPGCIQPGQSGAHDHYVKPIF